MAFTVTGKIDGTLRSVSLADAELDGDPVAIERVLELVETGEVIAATPTGPMFNAALAPEGVALVTLVAAFDSRSEILVGGDVPEIPGDEIPDGATP